MIYIKYIQNKLILYTFSTPNITKAVLSIMSVFQILVKLFLCCQKPRLNCLVILFQAENQFGTNRNGTNMLLSGFENGSMQIRTERCPNEAISKPICRNFGRGAPGLETALPCLQRCLTTDEPPAELNQLNRPSEARPCCKPRPAGALQTKTKGD